jgi:ATP-dependent RNA helicase RhlE
MTTFSQLNLSRQLVNALDDLGLKTATPIQEKAFPVIMSGRDTIGIAQTGTGKTFAYLLPLIRQHAYSTLRHPRVLIIVPTRELVVQVEEEIKKLAKYMNLRVAGIYGASNINKQKQAVYDGLDFLVATPGRMIDLVIARAIQLKDVKKLVIDEVDEMLSLGFRSQLEQILDLVPPKRQNILFSATLPEEAEVIVKKYFNDPEYVELISRGTPLEKIKQKAIHVLNYYTKINLLRYLLEQAEYSKVLLFVKNKQVANRLEEDMNYFHSEMGVIHSNKSQPARFEAVNKFQSGEYRLLVATDVISRGIDFKDVTHVINFDMPDEASSYIHRIGRTGRADKAGSAVSFVTKKDLKYLEAASKIMNKKIKEEELPKEVEVNEELIADEVPVKRDKNLAKAKKKLVGGGAFHEKKEKNKKEQLGGARFRENMRRQRERRNKNR